MHTYPPPCLWHAWRVVWTGVCSAGIPTGIPSQQFRNSCWISTLRLEIPPEFQLNLSQNLTHSGRTSLGSILSAEQVAQKSSKCNLSQAKPFVLTPDITKCKGGVGVPGLWLVPLGPPACTQNPTKIQNEFNRTNIADKITSRLRNRDPKAPNMDPTPAKISEIKVWSWYWKCIRWKGQKYKIRVTSCMFYKHPRPFKNLTFCRSWAPKLVLEALQKGFQKQLAKSCHPHIKHI